MNREFKFRVWSKQTKRWLTINDWYFDFNGDIHFIDVFPESTDGPIYPHIEKEQFVIQQYTGLKDKNDKKIYEGDILKFVKWASPSSRLCDRVTETIQIVRYMEIGDNPMASFVIVSNNRGDLDNGEVMSSMLVGYSEVIGNIFENPELLK